MQLFGVSYKYQLPILCVIIIYLSQMPDQCHLHQEVSSTKADNFVRKLKIWIYFYAQSQEIDLSAIPTIEFYWHYATVAQNKYLHLLVALLKLHL